MQAVTHRALIALFQELIKLAEDFDASVEPKEHF